MPPAAKKPASKPRTIKLDQIPSKPWRWAWALPTDPILAAPVRGPLSVEDGRGGTVEVPADTDGRLVITNDGDAPKLAFISDAEFARGYAVNDHAGHHDLLVTLALTDEEHSGAAEQ